MSTTTLTPVLSCLLLAASSVARAQEEGDGDPRVTVTALVVPEDGATASHAAIAQAGIRRGLRQVDGIRYIHPAELMSVNEPPEDVAMSLQDLDPVADMVRTGDAAEAQRRAAEAIRAFEANLAVVKRSSLIDAYMLEALASCRLGRDRGCDEGFESVLTFRESATYDGERYPPDFEGRFEEARARVQARPRGRLEVIAQPEGAEVFIDGRSYGPSPIVADELIAGAHYVTVQAVGYEKLIQRAEVRGEDSVTIRTELRRTARASNLESDLANMRGELGARTAGEGIRALRGYLIVHQVIIGIVRPSGSNLELELYLYDLRTNFLLAHKTGSIPPDAAGALRGARVAVELYEGVDLSGTIAAPDDEDGTRVVESTPLWQRWWFWTAVGVVVVSGIVALGFAASSGETHPIRDGWTRIEGQLP